MAKISEHVSALFPTKSVPMGDTGQRRRHHLIACSNCPAEGSSPAANDAGGLGLPELTRRFTRQGWYVGRVAGAHLCPDCNPTRQRAVLTVVPRTEPEPVKEEPMAEAALPRELSFADRRIINAKLEETYENDLVGYRTGWNDEAVAKDLGVDVVWVAKLRSENFGPATGNQVVAELRNEYATLQSEFSAWRKQGQQIADRLDEVERKLQSAGLAVAA